MDADAKCPGDRLNANEGIKNWQNLADVFYGWPQTNNNNNNRGSIKMYTYKNDLFSLVTKLSQ